MRKEGDRNNPRPVQGTSSLQTQHIWPQSITKASTLPASHTDAFYSQAPLPARPTADAWNAARPGQPPCPVPVSSKEEKKGKTLAAWRSFS